MGKDKEKFKSRWFHFTNYDMDYDWNHKYETENTIKYIAYGLEHTKSGRPHHQGWMYVKNPLYNTRRLLGTMHSEIMKGNIDQNDSYCSKENELVKIGIKPKQGNRRDISDIMDSIRENGESSLDIAQDNPNLWVQYGRRFDDYRRLLLPRRTWKTEVSVFWGESGTGKTSTAWELAPNAAVVSFHNGFIIGYSGEEDVIFDDFEDSSIPRQLFLQLTDRYPLKVNIKNGEMEWAPKRIIITSNFNPKYWFSGCEAVARRLDYVENL